MKYSFIIPTLNEEKLITRLLQQLNDGKLKKQFDYEIIVSDGGSNDRTIELSGVYADKIVPHSPGAKSNIAVGRNRGAAESNGKILIFINGDVIIDNLKGFLDYINDYFKSDEHIAMTCSVLVSPDEALISDKLFLGFYNRYFRILNFIGIGMGRGECQIVRKSVFNLVAGYNEDIAAGEDFDLFRRIRQIGSIKYAKDLAVYESPRRYRKYGHPAIFFSWLSNSISVMLFGKSISKEWEQVR